MIIFIELLKFNDSIFINNTHDFFLEYVFIIFDITKIIRELDIFFFTTL